MARFSLQVVVDCFALDNDLVWWYTYNMMIER